MSDSNRTSGSGATKEENQLAPKPYDRLQKLKAKNNCLVCGGVYWYAVDPDGNSNNGIASGSTNILVYTRLCSRCGYIQQFGKEVLDKVSDGVKG